MHTPLGRSLLIVDLGHGHVTGVKIGIITCIVE